MTFKPNSNRRLLLSAAAVGSISSVLASCGGGSGGEEDEAIPVGTREGIDLFTIKVKLINLAATEDSISVDVSGDRYFSNVPYATVADKTLKSRFSEFVQQPFNIIGNSGIAFGGTASELGQALYLITSGGDATGKTTSFRLATVGGIPGPYATLGANRGNIPFAQILHLTSALGPVDVFSRSIATEPLTKKNSAPLVNNGAAVYLEPSIRDFKAGADAAAAFQLVFKDPVTGATVYDSGTRARPAGAQFFISRSAVRSTGLSVYMLDSTYTITKWNSV